MICLQIIKQLTKNAGYSRSRRFIINQVEITGLEPVTSTLPVSRSSQMS